jgi:ATP-dependent Clp protease adaptor protein ClpS
MLANGNPDKIQLEETEVLTSEENSRELVLYNDDFNTFDFVIKALIEVCEHEQIQAEQCTFIVHYVGKCVVKKGEYTFLDPMRIALIDRGLSAVIS